MQFSEGVSESSVTNSEINSIRSQLEADEYNFKRSEL